MATTDERARHIERVVRDGRESTWNEEGEAPPIIAPSLIPHYGARWWESKWWWRVERGQRGRESVWNGERQEEGEMAVLRYSVNVEGGEETNRSCEKKILSTSFFSCENSVESQPTICIFPFCLVKFSWILILMCIVEGKYELSVRIMESSSGALKILWNSALFQHVHSLRWTIRKERPTYSQYSLLSLSHEIGTNNDHCPLFDV